MLQYLVILLDDTSVSFCHYDVSVRRRNPISIEILRKGIRFAMMENLMIQFVYPDNELPKEIQAEIESIDHTKIMSAPKKHKADIMVLNGWNIPNEAIKVPLVLRTTRKELFEHYKDLKNVLLMVPRVNVMITDIESFQKEDFGIYQNVLRKLAGFVEEMYINGKTPQLNLLTDRMMLKEMNNCGAGDTTVTLAPNGRFYVCPAFYFDGLSRCSASETNTIGDLEHCLEIKNQQLFKISHAPICRHCDAYQCRRCIWLNHKTTLEVNTPSHEQCVVAHIERNISRELLTNIRKHGEFLPEYETIKELDYMDPFDKRDEWQQ